MSEKTEIICDYCGADLSITGNCVDWRLKLSNENIPANDGPVTAMMICPDIESSKHFCGIGCLTKWVNGLTI